MIDLDAMASAVVNTIKAATEPLHREIADLRRHIAALTLARGEPGPPGEKGETGPIGRDGRDGPEGAAGKDGRDGVDGLGFDDLEVIQGADLRSITIQMRRGARVKTCGTIRIPAQIYRGVWEAGRKYQHGDLVTRGGSQWHANAETTETPGEGKTAWTLSVKTGREGKPGPKGEKGDPGAHGKDGRDLTQMDPSTGRKW